MKILLLGCLGQVGKEIAELADKKNIEVRGFDISTLDITDSDKVTEVVFANAEVDFVINATGYTAVDKAEDEPDKAFAINRDGVKNLALACKANNLPLLHLSTDYVFDGKKSGQYTEDDLPNPLNIYGKSKLAGELELIANWEKHIILRVSWVFGKYGTNFVKTILRLASIREQLSIVGDQFGCPTAAINIAHVFLEMAAIIKNEKNPKWGIYNYCDMPATSWHGFAENIIQLGQKKHALQLSHINKITTNDYPTKALRPSNSELMVKKITKHYGILGKKWMESLKQVIDEVEL